MGQNLRNQNKLLLKNLVAAYPSRSKYAEIIARRLTEKRNIKTTNAMVYQCANGNTYNHAIAWQLCVLHRYYRICDSRINRILKQQNKLLTEAAA